jgi:CubicO group peptidase (beta-lactamase class C family)
MPQFITRRMSLALILSIFSALPLAAQQSPPTARFAELERVVLAELEETKTPGVVVALVQGETIIYQKGFGVANVETAQPVAPEMLFRIGSMTKMYTAAALVSLAEEGKIDLNAPIGKYLAGLPPRLASVTAHQLMSHTAGLADGAAMLGKHDESALAEEVRGYKDSQFLTDPGAVFSYANPGFVIAGYLLERLAGEPYSKAVQKRVLDPLKMARSTFQPTMAMTYPFSVGHGGNEGGAARVLRPMEDNSQIWPTGFLFSNAPDLGRFAIAFMNSGQIDGKPALSAKLIERLSTPNAPVHSQLEGASYGYGLMVREYRGVRLVEHGGTTGSFASDFVMAPAQRVALIVLANRNVHLMKTVEKALELMLPLAPKPPEPEPQKFTEREFEEYVGRYAQGPDNRVTLELVRAGEGLALKQGQAQLPLTKIGSDLFTIKLPRFSAPLRMKIVRGADGRVAYLHNRLRALNRLP